MPSVRQGGGYTLTFSKKNEDVKDILDNKKAAKIVVTDYICEAIRFFESNKDKTASNTLNNIDLAQLVKDEVAKALKNIPEQVSGEKQGEESADLEENLDYVNVDDD